MFDSYLIEIYNQVLVYLFSIGLLMTANLILASLINVHHQKFCLTKLKLEIARYAVILLVTILLYYTGGLIPNLLVISINNVAVNLQTAVHIVLITATAKAAYDCIKKLITIFKADLLVMSPNQNIEKNR